MIDIAHVPAYAERRGDGAWTLTIACCPLCGHRHRHGGGRDDAPVYGHRVAHCAGRDRAGDYILIPAPDGMARPVARRGKAVARGGAPMTDAHDRSQKSIPEEASDAA